MKKWYFLILACFLASGCAAAFRQHPFLNERIKSAETISVMPLDVEVYKISAGGVSELVDEFSHEAKDNIKYSLEQIVAAKGDFRLQYFPELESIIDEAKKQLFKDTAALFKAVDFSVISHTYTPIGRFSHKIKNFDYTLGPQIHPLLEYANSELLLFLRGGDYVSSGGRIALMILAAAVGGTPTNAGPPHLSASLVDLKSGDVLWYNYLCPQSGYNFRNRKSVRNFMELLLKGFPKKQDA